MKSFTFRKVLRSEQLHKGSSNKLSCGGSGSEIDPFIRRLKNVPTFAQLAKEANFKLGHCKINFLTAPVVIDPLALRSRYWRASFFCSSF
jgi:hypothetical protein